MSTLTARPASPTGYISFLGVTFAVLGLGLLSTWLGMIGASVLAHVIALFIGMGMVAFAVRRTPSNTVSLPDGPGQVSNAPFAPSAPAWALVLLALGAVLGILMLSSSIFFLGVFASMLCFFPWARIPLCRRHLLLACLAVWIGTASVLVLQRDDCELMFFPLATWIFWTCSFADISLKTYQSRQLARKDRIAAFGVETGSTGR